MTDDFYTNLPRRRMGAGALFTNAVGDPLLVEPACKVTWEIPGGLVEAGEDPRAQPRKDEDRVIIERDGVPVAAIVPLSVVRDAETTEHQREAALSALREVQAAFEGIPEGELQRELNKALAEAKEIQLAKRGAAKDIDAE